MSTAPKFLHTAPNTAPNTATLPGTAKYMYVLLNSCFLAGMMAHLRVQVHSAVTTATIFATYAQVFYYKFHNTLCNQTNNLR